MTNETYQQVFEVPEHHPSFPDHFPGKPLVPGALSLQWVFDGFYARWNDMTITKVKTIKFHTPLYPGEQCQFSYSLDRSKHSVRIRCEKDNELVLSGEVKVGDRV